MMKCINVNRKNQGSITVFLSLILLLILSLLFTLIEGARVSTAKIFAERALTTAMDSTLAEYYGPLWNEYHMFGLNIGPGESTNWTDGISSKLQDYMSYTFAPEKGLEGKLTDGTDLYDISVDSLTVSDSTMITDYQGELVINQAVEYMKYKSLGDMAEQLLEKMSLLETPKKVSIIYEEKQELEEKLVEIDEGVLELMMTLDGIKTSKKGLSVDKNGKLKTVPCFTKKICLGAVTKEEVGINQESIFLALKDSYYNPIHDFTEIKESIKSLEVITQNINQTQKEYNDIVTAITEANPTLEALNCIEDKSENIKKQIKEIKESINDYENQKDKLQEELIQYEEMKQPYLDHINSLHNNLSLLIREMNPCITSSIKSINKIIEKTKTAGPLIEEYESSLLNAKGEIGEDIYRSMQEDLNKIKRYSENGAQGYDFPGMRQTLENDLSILSQIQNSMEQGNQELINDNYVNAEANYKIAKDLLTTYQTRNLALDYSTIVLNKNDSVNLVDMANSFLQEGITGLVIDPETISEAELTEKMLPSVIAAMSEGNSGDLNNLSSFFENAVIGGKNGGMGNLFKSFGDGTRTLASIGEGMNTAAEKLLFQEYIKEHFYSFPKAAEDISARKPSVLSYEQEYLLVGKTSDKENLSSIISKILSLRTILDFVSILGDKDKCEEAYAAAAAMVGFTGLPILVSITKTLILLVWSFAEALVDTSAMLMGKSIPILKKNLVIAFPELILLNRSFIQKKASELTESKEASFSYHDYLYIFLLAKNKEDTAYRTMDLIQENIRKRYIVDFSIQNCLFGYKAEANFLVASKFTGISFIQKQLGQSPKGFQFNLKASYSY